MRNKEITLYQFSELSEEAKEKAINNLFDINLDHDWWEFTYEDAKNIGLKITSFDLDRNRNAKGEFLICANEVAQNILNGHGEKCETFKTAQKFFEEWKPVFNAYNDEAAIKTTLLEGLVKVIKNDHVKMLAPGEQVYLDEKGEMDILKKVNTD